MSHVFISYSHEDREVARRYASALEAAGLAVWWDDHLRSGEAFDEKIEAALRAASAVVVLWSKTSVASRWVRAEATLADRNKTLVPVMIEPCERPIMFELSHTVELGHWRGDAGDKAWVSFLGDVRRLVGTASAQIARRSKSTLADIAAELPPKLETLLAVLPFDNLSSDAEMEFFSDGVSEDILGRIALGSQLRVIGRTSSFQFRGAHKSKAAAALNATHVLDGSIRRAGDKVRISAHLTEAATQTMLWTDKYDRSLEDTFAVQDEISEAISAALQQTFTRVATKAVDPEAYDFYLRATPHSYSPEELRTNIALLEQCLKRAPDFGKAWGRLAHLRAFLRTYAPFAGRAVTAGRVKQELQNALAADPEDVSAFIAELVILPPYGSFMEVDAALERLRSLPDSLGGGLWTGSFLRGLGRVAEALEETERAYVLDSLNILAGNQLSLARMAAGKYEGVVDQLEGLMARSPDMHFAAANLMRAQAFLGNWEAVDQILDPASDTPLRELQEGILFINTKRNPSPENLGQMRDRLLSRYEKTGGVEISELVYAAHVGLSDEVFRLTDTARLGPRGDSNDVLGVDAYRTGLLFWKDMPEIRNDPRFVRLCARLGLVEYWQESGRWPDCVDEVPYDFRAACESARNIPMESFNF